MVSFTSSAIKKSGKKFAPKAPPRRPPPGSSRANVSDRPLSATPGSEVLQSRREPSVTTTSETPEPGRELQDKSARDATEDNVSANISSQNAASEASNTQDERSALRHEAPIATEEPPQSAPPAISRPPEIRNSISHAEQPEPEQSSIANVARNFVNAQDHTQDVSVDSRFAPATTAEPAAPSINPLEQTKRAESGTQTNNLPIPTGESTSSENQTPAPLATQTPASRTKRSRSTTSDAAADTSTPKPRKPRAKRKREPTPEESEHVEIAPTVVKMSELCKDLRTGKMSRREMELRNLEQAEAERKEKAKEQARSTPLKTDAENASSANGANDSTPTNVKSGPRMRIVNGEIVVDNASLQIDQHAGAARDMGDGEDVVESRLNRKVNQATYGKRTKTESWDDEMTDLFYRGLRMFGTDFTLISKMFPGRSRRHIKLKFNNEERRDPERIKSTLMGPSEAVDIQTYSELTNTVYEDVAVIQRELDEDKKRIEEQHEKERRDQEDLLRNPSGITTDTNVVPSIENNPLKKRRSVSSRITTY